ncbi:MAG: TolC family protein [Gemmatimonadota bacterium]|jgi:outer membrane protein TolC
MNGTWRCLRRAAVLALAQLAATAGAGSAQDLADPEPAARATAVRPAAGLTLDEVLTLAHERSPRLRAAAAVADAASWREPAAGTLPDPMLQLGVMNFSVPGLRTDMPNSMAPALQLMQMVPFPGKLGLSGRIAEQSTAMARAAADEAWWQVRSKAAMSFYELYEADRKIEVMRETLGLLEDLEDVAKAMYASGQGPQSDVLRANVEVSRMDAEIRRMQAMREVAAARLNGLLDRPADTPVPTPVLGTLPDALPPADTLRAWSALTRPMLERNRIAVEQAETRQSLARRQIWPDLTFGVQYGQRSGSTGTARMASAMVGFSLPIFASKRQYRMRDEAAAMEQMARADLAGMKADVDARIGELLADLERDRTLVRLYRAEVLPQANANVESALSSYRVGTVDFMTTVDAHMTVNRYEQELYALLADYGRAVADLEMTVGRELPRTGTMLSEDR